MRAYTLPLEKQVQINLPLDASLPPEYIADEALRLQLYRRLSGMTTLDEIEVIAAEFEDRFGPLPELAQNLLYQLRLKALAIQAEVEAIVAEHRELVIRSEALEDVDRERLAARAGGADQGAAAGGAPASGRGGRSGGPSWRGRWRRCGICCRQDRAG